MCGFVCLCVDGLRQCVRVHSVSLSVRRWASPVCTCALCQSGLRQCVRVHSVSLSV